MPRPVRRPRGLLLTLVAGLGLAVAAGGAWYLRDSAARDRARAAYEEYTAVSEQARRANAERAKVDAAGAWLRLEHASRGRPADAAGHAGLGGDPADRDVLRRKAEEADRLDRELNERWGRLADRATALEEEWGAEWSKLGLERQQRGR